MRNGLRVKLSSASPSFVCTRGRATLHHCHHELWDLAATTCAVLRRVQAAKAEVLEIVSVRAIYRAVSIAGLVRWTSLTTPDNSGLQESCRRVDVPQSSRNIPAPSSSGASMTSPERPHHLQHQEPITIDGHQVDDASASQRGHRSPHDGTGRGSREATEREVTATILEFLAWGRRKQVRYVSHLPSCADELSVTATGLRPGYEPSVAWSSPDGAAGLKDPLVHLQMLLPDKRRVYELVQYRLDSLLWYHGSFHASLFVHQLTNF